MSDNTRRRATLRRRLQREESCASLASRPKRKRRGKNKVVHKKSKKIMQTSDSSNKENEDEVQSSSSGSSQDFQRDLQSRFKSVQGSSYQSELEVPSVMTRSATRKYASVGAIHNKVDFEKELKVKKRWPASIAYPIPDPVDDLSQLKDVVTRSLNAVMSFCRNAKVSGSEELQKSRDEGGSQELGEEFASCVDLSPYLTVEPVITNRNDDTQITFHLNHNFGSGQFTNITSSNEGDRSGTFIIQGDIEDYETITLDSGETYPVDEKYFSNTNSNNNSYTGSQNIFPENLMIAIHNDHTYASTFTEKIPVDNSSNQPKSMNKDGQDQFKLENALNDLLLNTAILKCLVCGETPQEMASFLDRAHPPL